jgi:hypothetical protein
MDKYRLTGGRLGAYIRSKQPTTQQIQALLGDLLSNDELLIPAKDAVARPGFKQLASLAGSGTGTVQRNALLQELARAYLPSVVNDLKKLLNGMLDIGEAKDSSDLKEREKEQPTEDPWNTSSHEARSSASQNSVITINQLADELEVNSDIVLGILISKGIIATATQTIEPATAKEVVEALRSSSYFVDSAKRGKELRDEMVKVRIQKEKQKRLSASEICDENLWNRQRDPDVDRRFLEAWNLRWFNKKYRPRLEKD